MKRTTSIAVTALLALAALQGRAAAGTTAPAPTAPATWPPSGTAINGAALTADAPPMKPGVTYRDTIKSGQTKIYDIALDAKSSAYASAFALPAPGTAESYGDGLELELQNSDGSDCDSQNAHFGDDGDPRPIGTAVVWALGDPDNPCQGANQYTLQVTRTSAATSDPGAWPLELRFVEEPGLTAGSPVPTPAPTVSASPVPLTSGSAPKTAEGGASFASAAALQTGVWKDRVLPGETRFYKVPVNWGQQATVFADFSSSGTTTAGTAFVTAGVRLTAYSPVRQLVDGNDGSYDGTPTVLMEQLAPVSYGNRAADDDAVRAVRFAGWYYFAVTVHPGVAKVVHGRVPVILRVRVAGTARRGPAYTTDPRPAGIGIDAQDVASANGTATGGRSSSAALRFVAFAAFGAGTVLLLTPGVWFLAARRQRGLRAR